MQTITAHGMRIPKLGLGTFRMRGEECTQAVLGALDRGYRHIDTAQMYGTTKTRSAPPWRPPT